MRNSQFIFFLACFFSLPLVKAETVSTDNHIREIVKELLAEKDNKIEILEARIQQLEQKLLFQSDEQVKLKELSTHATNSSDSKQVSHWDDKFAELGEQVEQLKSSTEEHGLVLNGFFDFSARTENQAESTFNLGAVELDLEYAYNEYFAASSALVWDGDVAAIGVAVVDFHLFDDSIPARGRIFSGQGFHLQAGRFDLPFSTDYQYFAAPDRVTVSAPLTTERIQKGGYNGDGVRLYGSWEQINYAVFWTNSVYEDQGTSFGGRFGLSLGKNTFRLHRQNDPGILELGVSHLTDLDGSDNARSSVYGADISFNYGFFALQSELAWLNSHETVVDANDVSFGRPNEFSYHATLIADLESFLHHPLKTYIRYGHWNPSHSAIIDGDDTYAVDGISRLTVGFHYAMNDYLQMKFEYVDSLGSETQEPDFEKQMGTAQLVIAF